MKILQFLHFVEVFLTSFKKTHFNLLAQFSQNFLPFLKKERNFNMCTDLETF